MIYTLTLNPCIDVTIECERFTLDALNRTRSIRNDIGGKGINVSKTIHALGGRSTATGFVAGETGKAVRQFLRRQNIPHHFMELSEGETRNNFKIIDTDCKTQTELNGTGPPATLQQLEQLLEMLARLCRGDDIIVVSGSAPPGLGDKVYHDVLARLDESGASILLDVPGQYLPSCLAAKPFLVKPNLEELAQATGRQVQTIAEAAIAAEKLIGLGAQSVLASFGSSGSLFVNTELQLYLPVIPVSAVSCIGAGDAMVAGLAFGFEHKMNLTDILCLSQACGAAAVMTQGTQALRLPDVQRLIPQAKLISAGEGIVMEEQLL